MSITMETAERIAKLEAEVERLKSELAAAKARITELKQSMASHFQREHIEGDGPEIDRFRARLAAANEEAVSWRRRWVAANERAEELDLTVSQFAERLVAARFSFTGETLAGSDLHAIMKALRSTLEPSLATHDFNLVPPSVAPKKCSACGGPHLACECCTTVASQEPKPQSYDPTRPPRRPGGLGPIVGPITRRTGRRR